MKDPKLNFSLDSPLIPDEIRKEIYKGMPKRINSNEEFHLFMKANNEKLTRFTARIKSEEGGMSNAEKIDISLSYLKVLFSSNVIENLNLDLKFIELDDEDESGEMESFRKPMEFDVTLRLAVHRRRIANLIMQGKAILSQRILSTDKVNKLSEEQVRDYKGFIDTTQDMFKKVNDETHRNIASSMGGKNKNMPKKVFGFFKINWEGNTPILFARSNNILLMIHEVTKGIHELGFMEQLSQYDEETLKKIYSQCDTLQDEQIGFKYSEQFVTILENKFRTDIELPLYATNEVEKIYDDNDMFLFFWSALYNPKHISDEQFAKLLYNWLSNTLTNEEIDSLKNLYLIIYEKHKINNEILDDIENRYTINDLLDKIANSGINSLTINEKLFLDKQSTY